MGYGDGSRPWQVGQTRLPERTPPGPQILWILSFLATRQGLPQPLLPPQMPAGPCPQDREDKQGEDLGAGAVLKEPRSGVQSLGPSLTSATYCATADKASCSVK